MTQKLETPQTLAPQNDLADALTWLARFFGGSLREFLLKLAEFFDQLTADPEKVKAQYEAQGTPLPQGLFDNAECLGEIGKELQQVVLNAGLSVVEALPGLLQKLLACALGGGTTPQAAIQINFACIFQAAMVYFRTRDIAQAAAAFFACQFGGGGGNGGGGNPPPVPPGNPIFRDVTRC